MSTATAMNMSLRLHARYSYHLQAADTIRPPHRAGIVTWSLQELSTSFCHQMMPRCLTVDMQEVATWLLQQVRLQSNDKQFCVHTSSLKTSTWHVQCEADQDIMCLLLDASWNTDNAGVSVSLSQLHCCHSPEGGTAIRSATTPLCIPPFIPAPEACM